MDELLAEWESIEFRVTNLERFGVLQMVFTALKADKESKRAFDAEWYWMQCDAAAHDAFQTAYPSDPTDDRWDFESWLDAIAGGEYTLLDCTLTAPDYGRLRFQPWGFPYGGSSSLCALVEAFGGRITRIDDGAGPPRIFPDVE